MAMSKETEWALRVYRNMPDLIFLANGDLTIEVQSEAAQEVFGDLVGKNLEGICRDEAFFSALRYCFGRGRDIKRELDTVFSAPGGESVPVKVTAFARNGPQPEVYVHARDKRELFRMQEQALVQERMASVGVLAAGVAHEFNNILSGIEGYAQIVRRRPEQAARLAEVVEKQARRAAEIVRNLLGFAKPSTDTLVPVDLNTIVTEVAVVLSNEYRNHRVRLEVEKDRIPPVLGNSGELQQIIFNLLVNAREAVGNDGLVSVRTRQAGGDVLVEVSDNGCGMGEEAKRKAFMPFFSTKGARSGDSRGGTGLGLYIVYSLVEKHEGAVSVESEPGAGTTFILKFPATDAPLPEGAMARKPFEPLPPPEGLLIMVVDDEAEIRSMLRDFLGEKNRVYAFPGADEAMARVQEGLRPDVVLLDLTMAGQMDGYEFFGAAKAVLPGMPIVVMTGHVEDERVRECRRKADGFLSKPFDLDDMEQALAAVTSHSRTEGPVRVSEGSVEIDSAVRIDELEGVRDRLFGALDGPQDRFSVRIRGRRMLPSPMVGLLVAFTAEAGKRGKGVVITAPREATEVLETAGILHLPEVRLETQPEGE